MPARRTMVFLYQSWTKTSQFNLSVYTRPPARMRSLYWNTRPPLVFECIVIESDLSMRGARQGHTEKEILWAIENTVPTAAVARLSSCTRSFEHKWKKHVLEENSGATVSSYQALNLAPVRSTYRNPSSAQNKSQPAHKLHTDLVWQSSCFKRQHVILIFLWAG